LRDQEQKILIIWQLGINTFILKMR
jgi:hypothetical protein